MIGLNALEGIDKSRIRTLDWGPFGKGYECTGPDMHAGGTPNYFDRWGDAIQPGDQKRIPQGGLFQIPDADSRHYLMPGEILLDLEPRSFQRPVPAMEAWMLARCREKYDLDRLSRMPRVKAMLDLYLNMGDSSLTASGPLRTFWWHHENRRHRWGQTMPAAFEPDGRPHWYYGLLPRSEPGFTTHYETILWTVLAYLLCEDEATKQRTWTSLVWMALGSAALEVVRDGGSQHGMFRDEGGGDGVTGSGHWGGWSKQTHYDGMVAMYALTGHPLLRDVAYSHADALTNRFLSSWDGYGERVAGWPLINAWTAFQLTRHPQLAANANRLIDQLIHDQDMDGLWSKKPGAHSGWMVGKIVSGALQWLAPNDPRRLKFKQAAASVYSKQVDWSRGHPYVAYRYAPLDWTDKAIHVTTHPALVSMATRHAGMVEETARLEDAVEKYIGSNWQDVSSHTPVPLDTIEWAAGNAGPGGLKVPPSILTGLFR